MTRLLDTIEQQLTAGISRERARRRRTRHLTIGGGAATVALLGAGVGIAANVGSPVERTVNSPGTGRMGFGIAPGAPREDVRVTDPGGLSWTIATYLAKNGTLTTTRAPDGLRGYPGGGGAAPFVIADNLLESGPAADDGNLYSVRHRGRNHYLLSGDITFGNDVPPIDHVDVTIAGRTSRATLAEHAITLPVRIDNRSLTSEGRQRVKRFPKTVTVRPYAATFPPDTFRTRNGRATITVTLRTGKTISYTAARNACFKQECGKTAPRVP